jgi:poly [ADP-ribose] polymerase
MIEVDKAMLIKADAGNNNNKFYDLRLYDDGTVKARYGRVGTDGQNKSYSGGRGKFDKIIADKTKPENKAKKGGYKVAKVTGNGTSSVKVSNLAKVAQQQIKYSNCKQTQSLIKQLVSWNVHEIAAHSTMTVNIASGQIELPSGLGVLTPEAIGEARNLLLQLEGLRSKSHLKKNKKDWATRINNYLMLVPQVLPSKKGWIDTIYSTPEEIKGQEDLLDSLESTLDVISTTPGVKKTKKVFDLDLKLMDDKKVAAHIQKLYQNTRKRMHSSYGYKIKNIYSISIGYMKDRYGKCAITNPKELWHGTGVGNLLSILKNGLIIPANAAHGRAFGNGVYFSDQSTKALNYASGYWGGRNGSGNCFMFLADVRMGKEYKPYSSTNRYGGGRGLPMAGYDSTFAEGGHSGVANNEMIVYKLNQINLKFLVEFEN